MEHRDKENKVVKRYQQDEQMMILIYAQWCVNHNLSPTALYRQAYPDQWENEALADALSLTVPKEDAQEISTETVLQVLQLFGNDDLGFIVQQEANKLKNDRS